MTADPWTPDAIRRWEAGGPLPALPTTRYGRPKPNPNLLTVAEVAAHWRVSKMTVYRLIHSGELQAVRVGRGFRVWRQAADEYLRSAEIGAEP